MRARQSCSLYKDTSSWRRQLHIQCCDTAAISPQNSSHLSRVIYLYVVCTSDSPERTTKINVELVLLQRLDWEMWPTAKPTVHILDGSIRLQHEIAVLILLCPFPSQLETSQFKYELSSSLRQHLQDMSSTGIKTITVQKTYWRALILVCTHAAFP